MSKIQVDRIRKMEKCLNDSREAFDLLSFALDRYEAVRKEYFRLDQYYVSGKWMEDFEADEAGKLPANLKRGVLSEDAVYDLITDHKALLLRMQETVLKDMKNSL